MLSHRAVLTLVLITALHSPFVCAEQQEKSISELDTIHSATSSALFSVTDDIDEFFGDIRSLENRRTDYFRVGAEVRFRAADSVRVRERLRAKINLSDISKRLRFFVDSSLGDRVDSGRTVEDIIERDDFVTEYQGDAASTGISYDFYRDSDILVAADAGLKFGGAHPSADVRASKWFSLAPKVSFEPTQYLQYIEGDGFGERTRADLNYRVGDQGRVRARTEVVWSGSSRGVDMVEDITYIYKFTDRSYAGAGFTVTAYNDPQWTPDVYKASIRYRQLLYKNWLYLETEPALEFPEERDYRTTPAIAFRFDMYLERY